MFGRVTSIKLKPGSGVEFAKILEQELIPLFRKERDFLGLLAFILPDGTEALSLSLWDHRGSAEANRATGLSTVRTMARVVLGNPTAQVYEVSNSTFHDMKRMMGQGKAVEETPDLEIYRVCAPAFHILAHTVHAEPRFQARAAL
jgi:hypothetical protein